MICRVLFLTIVLNVAMPSFTQNAEALRDSLSAAIMQLEYYPDSVSLRMKKAGWNIELEQWQYALDEYDYVLRKDPENATALFYRAFVNERQGRYNFARSDYESLLSLVPGNFEVRLCLALLNQKDNRTTEALDQINQLVEHFPDSAVTYAVRAGIELDRGMKEIAEYDYSKAIERDSNNVDYRLNRAVVRIELNRKKEAREDLDALVLMGVPRASLKIYYDNCR